MVVNIPSRTRTRSFGDNSVVDEVDNSNEVDNEVDNSNVGCSIKVKGNTSYKTFSSRGVKWLIH